MAGEALISLEEYLNTSYDPDVEYVDGVLVERNIGAWPHSSVQANVIVVLARRYPKVKVLPVLRSKTSATRYRLPDVSVVLATPTTTKALMEPAFVAIEILSEEDRMTRVIEKLQEYAANRTPHIWLIDPYLRLMYMFHGNTLEKVDLLVSENPRLELAPEEVFAE